MWPLSFPLIGGGPGWLFPHYYSFGTRSLMDTTNDYSSKLSVIRHTVAVTCVNFACLMWPIFPNDAVSLCKTSSRSYLV